MCNLGRRVCSIQSVFYLYQTVTATKRESQQYGGPEGHNILQQKHFRKCKNAQSMTFEEKYNTSVNTMTFHKRPKKENHRRHFRYDSQKNISVSRNMTFNKTATFQKSHLKRCLKCFVVFCLKCCVYELYQLSEKSAKSLKVNSAALVLND